MRNAVNHNILLPLQLVAHAAIGSCGRQDTLPPFASNPSIALALLLNRQGNFLKNCFGKLATPLLTRAAKLLEAGADPCADFRARVLVGETHAARNAVSGIRPDPDVTHIDRQKGHHRLGVVRPVYRSSMRGREARGADETEEPAHVASEAVVPHQCDVVEAQHHDLPLRCDRVQFPRHG